MSHFFKNKSIIFFLLFLIITGVLLRFYRLDWGSPYYFHPDERNIASSISQLHFPDNMHPHFFAYGSLPIYITYFSSLPFSDKTTNHHVLFEQAIISGRFFSAFFSLLLIPLMYLLGKKLHDKKTGLIAAVLTTFSTGFLQFAHFATFELWTTFFVVLLFHACLTLLEKRSSRNIITAFFLSGILASIKISNLSLLPIPIIVLCISLLRDKKITKKKKGVLFFVYSLLYLTIISLVFLITNPFVFLDQNGFKDTITYESNVALGSLPVFYTSEFFNTVPIVFQFIKIYPFLINPIVTILFLGSFFYLCFLTWKKRSLQLLLLLTFFCMTFFSQAFLFAKWTRYMIPTLPFIYLIIAITWTNIMQKIKNNSTSYVATVFLFTITIIFSLSYWITAFMHEDSRIQAAKTATTLMQNDRKILSEIYDMGIVAFNEHFMSMITLHNFYELDNNSPDSTTSLFKANVSSSDYLILPSQRLLATRIGNPKKFPNGYVFYKEVLINRNKFVKIYETPCDIFCKITYLGDPIFRFEGTASTFDHPPVQIFRINHE